MKFAGIYSIFTALVKIKAQSEQATSHYFDPMGGGGGVFHRRIYVSFPQEELRHDNTMAMIKHPLIVFGIRHILSRYGS